MDNPCHDPGIGSREHPRRSTNHRAAYDRQHPDCRGSISLNEDQQIKIKQFLGKQKPASLQQNVTIGGTLPDGIDLHDVSGAEAGLPAIALNFRYALAESQVFIVDPRTRRVVGIIPD
jgi:hypothetical protein